MQPRFDRRTLNKAKPEGIIRLAKFVGINVPDNCTCDKCKHELIEVLVRKLDQEESWPPRNLTRRW